MEGTDSDKNLPEESGDRAAYAIIGSYRTTREAHDAGLAVLAGGHSYWVKFSEGRFLLVVPGAQAEKLKREVDLTASRNRFWPPRSLDLQAASLSKWPSAAFVLLLVFVFWAQNEVPELVGLGVNSSQGTVENGEWWRVVTAVTLHADIGHLAGNLLGISIFAYLCCRYLGNGLAWLLILFAAGLSNLTNAFLNSGEPYSSLGASTAVFAALGILTGFPLGAYLRSKVPLQSRDWLVPFFGGCVVFAWMGGGDFPTDVPGHFWSFGYGLGTAVVVAWSGFRSKVRGWQQHWLLGLTYAVFLLSWGGALGLIVRG